MEHTLRIRAARSPGEVRVAVTQDGGLVDYAIWRPGTPDGVGDLHRGRIAARVSAMAGAFVALAGGEGFLPDSEGGADTSEGQILGVRVTRAAQGGKGPRLTARLADNEAALAGDGPVRLIRRGPDPIEELAARYSGAEVLRCDGIAGFDAELEEQIAALASPEVALPGGGRMHIQPTPALVAIDIDAGSSTAERREKSSSQQALNRGALPELARQIRLRNLSGAILVDFAGLSARRRAGLEPELRRALASDPLRPRLLGFTQLGLAEIVRPRVHPPLHEVLAGPLAAGLAALRQVEQELAVTPARRAVLTAAPAIVTALQTDTVALPELAHRIPHPLVLRSDPALSGCRLEFRDG